MSGWSCFAFRRVFAELFTSNIFMPADYFVSSLSWFASDMDDELGTTREEKFLRCTHFVLPNQSEIHRWSKKMEDGLYCRVI